MRAMQKRYEEALEEALEEKGYELAKAGGGWANSYKVLVLDAEAEPVVTLGLNFEFAPTFYAQDGDGQTWAVPSQNPRWWARADTTERGAREQWLREVVEYVRTRDAAGAV